MDGGDVGTKSEANGSARLAALSAGPDLFWNELTHTLDDLGSLVTASRERIESLMAQVSERDDVIAGLRAKVAMLEAQVRPGITQILPIADPKLGDTRSAGVGGNSDSGIWRRLKRLERH